MSDLQIFLDAELSALAGDVRLPEHVQHIELLDCVQASDKVSKIMLHASRLFNSNLEEAKRLKRFYEVQRVHLFDLPTTSAELIHLTLTILNKCVNHGWTLLPLTELIIRLRPQIASTYMAPPLSPALASLPRLSLLKPLLLGQHTMFKTDAVNLIQPCGFGKPNALLNTMSEQATDHRLHLSGRGYKAFDLAEPSAELASHFGNRFMEIVPLPTQRTLETTVRAIAQQYRQPLDMPLDEYVVRL